jgi:ATP-dependent helicase/nuclease subunit A
MSSDRPNSDPPGQAAEHAAIARDDAARTRAVDPRFNVALEASAGTGKTRVLVDRYVNLLRAGVDPGNILAMTFTRKAAAEMRERIVATLRAAGERGEFPPSRWRDLRDRTTEIAVSTIDAFCLSLLREFPLEADLDPGFAVADQTEVLRLVDGALDRTLRVCRALAREDEAIALAFAQLGERRVRSGLAHLLDRRLVAPNVLAAYLRRNGAHEFTLCAAGQRASAALMATFAAMRGGLDAFLDSGPLEPSFELLARGLRAVRRAAETDVPLSPAELQLLFVRVREHFLTQEGEPRSRSPLPKGSFASEADWRAHRDLVVGHAPAISRVIADRLRDLNVLVSRGVWRMFKVADAEYRRALDAHALVDFSDLLARALDLLKRMDEFARSRFRLESRYHHLLLDEFQDTSRPQWELVALLVQSWGEGAGLAHTGPLQPSIFIVGDRKQSIYGFRDADVSVLREAARHLGRLRPDGDVRRTITRSFRATAPLLAFVNDVCTDMAKAPARADAFEYDESDRFPVEAGAAVSQDSPLGLVVADDPDACAEATAAEIHRMLAAGVTVRDRESGVARAIRPGDIAILFRTRESHREFEAALERRAIRSYVYQGLGFFDADEIKDVLALVAYLGDPASDLRAAAFLRSRIVALSDEGLRRLSPGLAAALSAQAVSAGVSLREADRTALEAARDATRRWLDLVDRVPPAELVDAILSESAYAVELAGPRWLQARENLKKMRALLRRGQNRGYATIPRLAAHLDRLAIGEESNAVIEALDAVNLLTVHAAKGLEFPVVFLVNLGRGTGNRREPVRVVAHPADEDADAVSVGEFQSHADGDRAVREREETKRLLYVALTRARDCLYLGAVAKDGRLQPGRGSLAEVLPASLLDLLVPGAGAVEWMASSGRAHRLRRCGDSGASGDISTLVPSGSADDQARARTDDFAPLVDVEPPPLTVGALVATASPGEAVPLGSEGRESERSERLVGTLVHRLLQRCGFDAFEGTMTPSDLVSALLRPDERAVATSERTRIELTDDVVRVYRALCARPEVRSVYTAGDRFHEVPFTMRIEGAVLRGTIDCLVRLGPDRVAVLEFKTGAPRDEHRRQLEYYRGAATRLFPGATVDAHLVYAGA